MTNKNMFLLFSAFFLIGAIAQKMFWGMPFSFTMIVTGCLCVWCSYRAKD